MYGIHAPNAIKNSCVKAKYAKATASSKTYHAHGKFTRFSNDSTSLASLAVFASLFHSYPVFSIHHTKLNILPKAAFYCWRHVVDPAIDAVGSACAFAPLDTALMIRLLLNFYKFHEMPFLLESLRLPIQPLPVRLHNSVVLPLLNFGKYLGHHEPSIRYYF